MERVASYASVIVVKNWKNSLSMFPMPSVSD